MHIDIVLAFVLGTKSAALIYDIKCGYRQKMWVVFKIHWTKIKERKLTDFTEYFKFGKWFLLQRLQADIKPE